MKACGGARWDADRSGAATGAPADLLQAIRDEIGSLNQTASKADDVWSP